MIKASIWKRQMSPMRNHIIHIMVVCCSSVLLVNPAKISSKGEWLTEPGTVRACAHSDAAFRWSYNESSLQPLPPYIWFFDDKTQDTILKYTVSTREKTFFYDRYRHRVDVLPGYNSGILLRNVTKADTGGSRVEMVGLTGSAKLDVYYESELDPVLHVDNEAVEFGSALNRRGAETVIVSIVTALQVPAQVNITVQGKRSHSCEDTTNCVSVVEPRHYDDVVLTVSIVIYYGFCSVIHGTVHIITTDPQLSNPGILHNCLHDNVTFNWNYDPNNTNDISRISWHTEKLQPIAEWSTASDIEHIQSEYEGRVELMTGQGQAGLRLLNVSKRDAGDYMVQLDELDVQDTAQLRVYSDKEFQPEVRVNNERVASNERLCVDSGSAVSMSVQTAHGLPADITISIKGEATTECIKQTSCNAVVLLGMCPHTTLTVSCEVDYHICSVQHHNISIVTCGDSSTGNRDTDLEKRINSINHISIATLVFLIVLVVLVLGKLLPKLLTSYQSRRKHDDSTYSKTGGLESMSKHNSGPEQEIMMIPCSRLPSDA